MMQTEAVAATTPVSVLVAGWEYTDNPVAKAMANYGCEAINLPGGDRKQIPVCDLAILATSFVSHKFSDRLREQYRLANRPIIFARGSFESCREDFEKHLAVVRQKKTPQVVRRQAGETLAEAKARAERAELRIAQREEVPVVNAVKIDPTPTVDSVIRSGYAQNKWVVDIAKELNRLGITTMRGKQWSEANVSRYANDNGFAKKGRNKGVAGGLSRDEILTRLFAAKIPAEQKLQYIERVHRGEILSLIDSGSRRDDKGALCLWRTPILEPENGIMFRITKAQACLVAEHAKAIEEFASEEEEE